MFTCPCTRSQTSADDVLYFAGGLEEVDWRPLYFVGRLLEVELPVPVASLTSRGELASPQGQCEPPVPPVVTEGGKQGATGSLPLHCRVLIMATCCSRSHRSDPEQPSLTFSSHHRPSSALSAITSHHQASPAMPTITSF